MGIAPSKSRRSSSNSTTGDDDGAGGDPFIQQGQSYIEKSQEQQYFLRAIWDGNFVSPVREPLSAG
ncbi:6005_t:CDS:1, partial [Ambispora leptoticha]